MKLTGHIIDIRKRIIFDGAIEIEGEKILSVYKAEKVKDQFILPGFIDAHVHIESSMVVPSEFARMAVVHGTVGTVSDPHEIGNVLGVDGVEYMIENGKKVNFKFNFGAPSCVPATSFETAGAEISPEQIKYLLEKPDIKYLAEMMNWPGVLYNDQVVYEKLRIAQEIGKPIDGHAPGLKGIKAETYIKAGISTDHECFSAAEARDKLKHQMKIAIREGSAAKNFDALVELFDEHPELLMFCSDDKHPDNLVEGHINQLVARAIAKGHNLFDVLKAACITPVEHYSLDIGTLRAGDYADFIVTRDLENFFIDQTFINGELVAKSGNSLIESVEVGLINNFNCAPLKSIDLALKAQGDKMSVIEAQDGQLITNSIVAEVKKDQNGFAISDVKNDLLKFVVVNRYHNASPSIGFIKNFNLVEGAIASSVGHDSHNILAVGVNDDSIKKAINLIIESKGGVSAVGFNNQYILPLPVAGIMSNDDGYKVAEAYTEIDAFAKKLGSTLASPFMTLSFMALLVIPDLKLSDLGLFDGQKFKFKGLFEV